MSFYGVCTSNFSVHIIDDDIDVKSMMTCIDDRDNEGNDDLPAVAEFVDERPKHVQQLEQYRLGNQWKSIAAYNESEGTSRE